MTDSIGWSYPKRKKYLDDLLTAKSDRTHDVIFKGRIQAFGKYRVPISLPKYRLANGRTLAAQAEYVAKHAGTPTDFFSRDIEDERAQLAQHSLLKEMTPGAGLLSYFKKHQQTEPLVISSQGFVINGNRRLCAMRQLLDESKKKYQHFEQVEVVILPPATEQEIDELEAQFQIHPDIKDEYSWYTKAMMLRRRRQVHNLKWEELANRYEMKEAEIKESIYMLEDAELWLQDRKLSSQYHLLDGKEYAFRQLRSNRDNGKVFPKPEHRDAFEKICYCLLDEVPKSGRLYDAIPSVAKFFPTVVANIRDDLDLSPEENLSDIAGATSKVALRSQIRDVVSKTLSLEKLKEKEKKQRNFVLEQVRKSNTALVDALNAANANTPQDGIAVQIAEIEKNIARLKKWLKPKQ